MAAAQLVPPIAPMLARLARELPLGDFVYEPKWDGFRCLAFAAGSGGAVDLRSRHQRPLARYFPEQVKRERTADCVVAGFRTFAGEPAVASLLLGLWDPRGALVHVGVSSSFPDADRSALFHLLQPLAVALPGHPWERGFNLGPSPVGRLAGSAGRWDPLEMALDWCAIRPERVAEVAYDQLDRLRFRHPARFVRWRPDRDARSCTLDQLAAPD